MSSNSMTLRSILAPAFCGLLLAVTCVGDCGPAAARGFGGGGFGHMGGGYGRMGGGRGFGGMHGGSQHQMTRSTGRTNRSSGRTGRDTSTNHNVNNLGANKTGNFSGAKTTNTQSNVNTSTLNASGANTGTKTTNTSGTVGNSTANTTGANTGSRTTTTNATGNTSTSNMSNTNAGSTTTNTQGTGRNSTGNTSITNTGSKEGSSPGTPGNSTSTTPVATTGSGTNGTGTVANGGSNTSDPPRGGGRIPGSQTPNLPLTPVGLGGGIGGNPAPAGAGGTGGTIAAGGNPSGGGGGGGGNNGSGVPPRGEQRFVPNEIVLGFSSRATPQQIDQLARRYGVTRLGSQSFPLIDVTLYRWHINGRRSVADTIGAIENERVVVSAQPNYLFTLQETAAKTFVIASGEPVQYVLGKLEIEQAHQVATGKNIPIAVINSEIDANHPDLAGAIAKSFDALGGDEAPQSHGTAMAGAIAARGKLSGIALGPHLLAARAFDNTAGGAKATSFAIYKSLQWAADNGARVINMSFAGPPDPNLHRMLTAAYDKGIVLVAAAGNAGPKSAPLYPAADPDVIAVTATDSNDGLFNMANRGSYIAVAAPGVDILALAPGNSYQVTTGTSVAAAHVSGIAAMLLEERPSLKPAEVRSIIMSTAKPLGHAGQQADFGAGLADAYRAVKSLSGKPPGKEDAEQARE